jgi:hypothetical protein
MCRSSFFGEVVEYAASGRVSEPHHGAEDGGVMLAGMLVIAFAAWFYLDRRALVRVRAIILEA